MNQYKHVSIRDNAESSILYKCENFEKTECKRLFNILIKKQFFLVLWRLPNNFFKQFFDYYGGLLSYALQFIPIIVIGTYDDKSPEDLAKIISNNAFYYIYLVNSFTRLTDLAIDVGEMAGVFQRIADFVQYSDEQALKGTEVEGLANQSFEEGGGGYDRAPIIVDRSISSGRLSEGLLFEMNNVSYTLPNDENYLLMHNLNIRLMKGQNLLVTGPSGAGKSSFLRVLMRLWNLKTGMLTYGITSDRILHCPQKSYFPVGRLSLRQQIAFPVHIPKSDNVFRDSGFIEKMLKDLKLFHLIERCGGLDSSVEFDWHESLTPGELQRLSFVRLLYHRPLLAILDEATNSVSSDMEKIMYQLLLTNDISFISAGHRQTLTAFHNLELKITGKTGYTIKEISVATAVADEKL
uniref:ABC transporter domain-containing protein n=1 Tax=Panagrolaimus sp. PS1159 TaxID=55785 RepID=A0AC35GRU5_9BILA